MCYFKYHKREKIVIVMPRNNNKKITTYVRIVISLNA